MKIALMTAPGFKRSTAPHLVVALSVSLGLAGGLAPYAQAKPTAVEWLQYLSPLPEKTYLNESQDRLIKKKSFKVEDLPDATPVVNRETGFFAIVEAADADKPDTLDALLAKPQVNGLSVLLPWSLINPQEDDYNWQPIDKLVEAAKKANKSIILRVSTCGLDLNGQSDTPKWVYDAGIKSLNYTGPDGKEHKMPVLWDTNYLAKWSNFIKDLGERYDKNPQIHSIGITGGGALGGTSVIPPLAAGAKSTKPDAGAFQEMLKKDHGMAPKQLVDHWKYVADLFPQAFPTARLNFDISPPTPNRAGQDMLDEISDYLIYRYGQRVYLTRQNVSNDKHGFDEYRVLLKFRPDTLTGIQLTPAVTARELPKLTKFALDDGISFAEIPAATLSSTNEAISKPLNHLLSHIGFQVVSQKASVAPEIRSGDPLRAHFTFTNLGAATPIRPVRAFDKDVASSWRIQVELRDDKGKPVVISLHTPEVPTNNWTAGKPVSWEEELKMPALAPGSYSVFMSVVDMDAQRKMTLLDGTAQNKLTPETTVPMGSIKVLPPGPKLEATKDQPTP